jgi:hypothetical protein
MSNFNVLFGLQIVWVDACLHIVTSWTKEVSISISYITLIHCVEYVLYIFLQKEHKASF